MLAFKPHKGGIFQVAFSPDGTSIATSGMRPFLCVSDAITGKARWQTNAELAIGLGLAYSPDGSKIAVVDWNQATLFDAESGTAIRSLPGRGYAVAFSPDGASIITGNRHPAPDAIRTNITLGTSERIGSLNGSPTFNRFQYSRDGRLLAAMRETDTVLLDGHSWRFLTRFSGAQAAGVGALVFHPTTPVLVYSSGPKLIAYDLISQSQIAERKRSKKYIQDAAFTPDGKHLITVSNDTMAVLWETTGWTEVREFGWEIGQLKSVAIAPDGSRAVCASDRGRVVVWDLDV